MPPEYSLESTDATKTRSTATATQMDYWEVYDNMGDGLPKLHSRKK